MKLTTIFALVFVSFTLPALAQTDVSILSDDYIVSQEFVEAKVVRVRTIARTITVRGENKGQTRTFSVPRGTRVSVNGRDARLSDIRPGDSLMLVMQPQASEVVVASIRVPQATTTIEQRRAEPVEEAPVMLPKTASKLPLVLVIGLFALVGAGMMRLRRK